MFRTISNKITDELLLELAAVIHLNFMGLQ